MQRCVAHTIGACCTPAPGGVVVAACRWLIVLYLCGGIDYCGLLRDDGDLAAGGVPRQTLAI
jgi:hypothetical protein